MGYEVGILILIFILMAMHLNNRREFRDIKIKLEKIKSDTNFLYMKE